MTERQHTTPQSSEPVGSMGGVFDRGPTIGEIARRYGIVGVLLLEMAILTFLSPAFLTEANLLNVARQAAPIGIIAVGLTFVILTAGIDLSVGSLVAFAGIIAAGAMERVDSGLFGVMVAILVGLGSGLFAGFVIAKLRVPPFIVTLAMLAMLQGATLLYRNGAPVVIDNELFREFGSGYVGPVPIPVILLVGTYLVGHWVLSSTKFGRHVYAIGGNETAARFAGIRVDRYIVGVYVISGLLASLGAVTLAGRLGTATPLTGQGLELEVIAAVIVGGTSLYGGVGTLWGTFAGVLIIAFLSNGLTLMDVSGFWQQFATGAVVLVAVLVDRLIYARK